MKKSHIDQNWVKILIFLIMVSVSTYSQVKLPRVSPHQTASHTIGLTEVKIDYHSPGVLGRQVWGGIVPYDMSPGVAFGSGNQFPWRAGANENTVISFTDEVKINGKSLPAGNYALFMIPGEKEFTIIFSKNFTSWGSFFYDENEDALRVTVTPLESPFSEWLTYGFDKYTPNSVEVYLAWEKLKIPFTVEIDLNQTIIASLRKELRSTPGFGWQGLNQAANWCAQNNVNQEEALKWIDRAITRVNNFATKQTKSALLAQLMREKESQEILQLAIDNALEAELNTYGYQLMNRNNLDKAIEMFKLNVDRFPDSWNVYDSLAECYQRKGDNINAKKFYEKALKMAPENQKERIKTTLGQLK